MNLKRINAVWPIIGGVVAIIIIIFVLFFWNRSSSLEQLSLLYWLNLAVLMLHEFEEYVLPGGFKHFINHKTVFAIPEAPDIEPITDGVILGINLGIWVIIIVSALITPWASWLGFGLIIFNVINILGHLIIFQKMVKGYNPGTITAILMIPFLIFSFSFIIQHQFLTFGEYIIAGLIGAISGGMLPILGTRIKKNATKDHSSD